MQDPVQKTTQVTIRGNATQRKYNTRQHDTTGVQHETMRVQYYTTRVQKNFGKQK